MVLQRHGDRTNGVRIETTDLNVAIDAWRRARRVRTTRIVAPDPRETACLASACGRLRVQDGYGPYCDLFWRQCCGEAAMPDVAAWRAALRDPPGHPPHYDGAPQTWPAHCVLGTGQ